MKFPKYNLQPTRKNVIGSYIDFVARTELDRQEPLPEHPNPLRNITPLIGEACVKLYTASQKKPGPSELFQQALEAAKKLHRERQPGKIEAAQAALLGHTCRILTVRWRLRQSAEIL